MKLHNLSQERENQLLDYFLHTQEFCQVHKTVGDWNMEVDIESLDRNQVRYLILQLRENFKDLIETFNITEFFQYHKKTTLPWYLFELEEGKEGKNQSEIKAEVGSKVAGKLI